MEPNDPRLWKQLETRAASALRPDFASHTLAAARRSSRVKDRWITLALPLLTAAACALITMAYHERTVATERTLAQAEWQRVAMETDTLSDL